MLGLYNGKPREVSFDNGTLSGDLTFIAEISHIARLYEIDGELPIGYSPEEADYTKDAMAVLMIANELCMNKIKLTGNFPKWDADTEDGVIY